MKYIIHSTVIFDTTEYLLTLLTDTNTSIKLSNSAGRILEELIKHQKTNEPISRTHLFSIVWKSHGLEPSHGNLNQQISLIRKSLGLLGISPSSIITIPKRGIKFNNQIPIKIMNEHSSTNTQYIKHQTNNLKNLYNKMSMLPESCFSRTNTKYTIIVLICIITTLSISIIYLYIKDKNLKKSYLCRQINSCNICTFHQTPNLECNDLTFKIPDKNQNNSDSNYKNHSYILQPCQTSL